MKKIIATLSFALFLTHIISAQGIEFFHGTWQETLAKAKAENKLIFVDAFASWCGPCKNMAANVFTQAKVGSYFNDNFINYKVDMEKPENSEFAGKYPVSAYPTLMMLDATGKLVQKVVGGQQADPLIEFGKKALLKTDKSVDFELTYNEGNREPKFLYEYVKALNLAGKPSLKITNEYLNTQTDLTSDFNLRFLLEGTVEADSRVFDLLVKNQTKAGAVVGADVVKTRLENACKNTVKKAIDFKNEALLEEAKTKMRTALPERADAFGYDVDMKYYAAIKDIKKYLKSAQTFQKNEIKNNSAKLHDLVITLLRAFPEDDAVLDQAEKWAKTASDNGGLAEYTMTLAGIYKLQGEKAKAKATAEKARDAIGEKDNGMKDKINAFIQSLEG